MATRVIATKTGLKLVCEVSAVPVPRPRQVFPLPDLHGAGWTFLTLATRRDSNTGALSLVATVDADLPGRRSDAWTLHWSGLGANGTCAVAAGDIRAIAPVQEPAPYQIWLSRQDAAGAVTIYPAATIDASDVWDPSHAYVEGDTCTRNGIHYTCLQACTKKDPTLTIGYWGVIRTSTGGTTVLWRGGWDTSTSYAANDAVSKDGSSYIALQASTSQDPTTAASYWGVMAKAGERGKDATAHETTKDLVLDADHGSVDLGLLSQFQRITFSAPGRLRIYVSEAARVADVARPLAVDATAGTGCLLEVNPNLVDGLGGSLTPLFTAAPEKGGDGLCYWTWEGATGTTCSLEYYNGTVAGTTIIPRDGTNVHQEPRDPLPADGISGDSWINNLTWNVWKKEAGSWVLKGNIKGATGPRGEKGDTGATGAKGDTGETGAKGDTGDAGLGVPAGGTTGQLLAKKSAADNDTEWVTAGGGGASYGGICYPVDTPPSSPDAWDDEFGSNTLSNWTQLNAAGLDYCAIESGHLHLQPNTPDAQTAAVVKAISGDFTITAKFVLMADALRNFYFGGLVLRNSASGNMEEYLIASVNGNMTFSMHTLTSPTSRSSYEDVTTQFGAYCAPYYLRVSLISGVINVWVSRDGQRWFQQRSNRAVSTFLGSVDQAGISCGRGPSTPSPSIYCEWIRRS